MAWNYDRRLATGQQVAKRFPQWCTSERTTRRILARLVAAGVLDIASVRGTTPVFPHVYLATARGIRFVRERGSQRGTAWPSHPPEQIKTGGRALLSVLHEIMATEFELMFEKTVAALPDVQLLMSERRYNRRKHRLKYWQDGEWHFVEPDIGLLTVGERTGTQLMFVEIDAGTIPIRRIYQQKLVRYHEWMQSADAEEYLERIRQRYGLPTTPSVRWLWVAQHKEVAGRDSRRLVDVLTETLALPTVTRERLWLTTASELAEHHENGAPLMQPIWIRARHARPWMRTFWDFKRTLINRTNRKAKLRSFVKERIAAMPQRSLFRSPCNSATGQQTERAPKKEGSHGKIAAEPTLS